MRAWSRAARGAGRRIGFVPPMGYLHEGPLHLGDLVGSLGDTVVMSFFVNPLQFGPAQDPLWDPPDLEGDRNLVEARGVGCILGGQGKAMCPQPPMVRVSGGPLTGHLSGPWRAGHFEGV